MGIETICRGGSGGCATVYVQLRNIFPGLGGSVVTEQDFVTACRIPLYRELNETNNTHEIDFEDIVSWEALNLFLRHSVIKKLDDYFFRKGDYRLAHIPRPLGSDSNGAYFYEWVYGSEGFYSEYFDAENVEWLPIEVGEWNAVSSCFSDAGISIFSDTSDPNDGRYTKNIILQEPGFIPCPIYITKLWKRIDFGSESLPINYDKLKRFIERNKNDLNKYLRPERVEMIELITDYLNLCIRPSEFKNFDRLTELVKSFRIATTSHMGVQGISPLSILKTCSVEQISSSVASNLKEVSFSRRMSDNEYSTLDVEIRSGFSCIDSTIYTLQEIPVAKYSLKEKNQSIELNPESGFKLFLRHFIIKKLENAFISQKRYTYAHIARPLGSEGNSYYYEWVFGNERCRRNLVEKMQKSNKIEGLDDWFEVVSIFNEAGIDLNSLEYTKDNIEYVKHIIIRQPKTDREDKYISRMWNRVYFDERHTPIDLDKLEKYIINNEKELKSNLTKGRYETMLLAVEYLKGIEMTKKEFDEFKKGIHDYRISALRHLNHLGFEPPPKGFLDLRIKDYS